MFAVAVYMFAVYMFAVAVANMHSLFYPVVPTKRYSEGEIRFNLMAIVSDRKMVYERKIAELQTQLTEASGLKLPNQYS